MVDRAMKVGRKRAFDKEQALDKAMRLFWKNGYSGTSLSDLTTALGINRPSLYAAFGNKEQLFAAALDRYLEHYGGPLHKRLTEPADALLRDRLRAYLLGVVDFVSGRRSPKGCLFVNSSCESAGAAVPQEIAASLRDRGLADEQTLIKLFKVEQRDGRLAPDANPQDIADYLQSVMYGLSVLARRGKPRAELQAVVEFSVEALLAASAEPRR